MHLIERSEIWSMTMDEIAFDEEYDAVVAPGQCTTQNSSLSMSTAFGYTSSTQRVKWVVASATSTLPNASFADGQRAAPPPVSDPGAAHAGSHLAAELP